MKYNELLDVHGKTEAEKENSKKTLNTDIRGLLMAVSEREKKLKVSYYECICVKFFVNGMLGSGD